MPRRSGRFKNFSIEERLDEWITPLVEAKTLGLKSHAEFLTAAVREKVEKYVELGIHPWSRYKKEKEPEKTSPNAKSIVFLVLILAGVFVFWMLSSNASPPPTEPLTGKIPVSYILNNGIPLNYHPTGSFVNPLSPLRANIPQIYEDASTLIDFLVFTAVFVSIAYVTIGRRLGHKGIAIAIGTVLAIALTAMEPVWGFNLKSFGPLAAGIFLLVLGYFIYGLLTHFGIDALGAASTSFVILYLGLSLYTPSLISQITERAPIIELALLVIFFIAAYKLGARILTGRKELPAIEPKLYATEEIRQLYPQVKEQTQIIKKYLANITKKARKQSNQIIAELAYINDVLDRFGDSPEARRLIAQKINDIRPQEHAVREMLSYLQSTVEQIRRFDFRMFQQARERYQKLTPIEQRMIKEEIQEELEKTDVEKKLAELETQWRAYDERFSQSLENAITSINAGDIATAKKHLAEAMNNEAKNTDILEQMKKLEQALHALTKIELHTLQR